MKKIKIGIPRGLYFYYHGKLYQRFFEKLGFKVITSPKTDYEILKKGIDNSVDEMCLPLKILLGHIKYLENKTDYIVIPRIDNYGYHNQTCTNFLAIHDICRNLFDIRILGYNINLENNEDEFDGFLKMGKYFNIDDVKIMKAYEESLEEVEKINKIKYKKSMKKLNSNKTKILLVTHAYNIYDNLIGTPILKYLNENNIEVIISDECNPNLTEALSKKISKDLYWKYSKEALGSIVLNKHKIEGIIFLSSFPCALDSISYELAFRKINLPYIHLVLDDLSGSAGIETRLESFLDIIEGKYV
jgi:Uncharacterized protein conserved in bacteria